MKNKIIISTLLIGLIATATHAVTIGYFPGLIQLIDKSDAIVILRIDEHIDYRSNQTLHTTHSCYIYQTLKGDVTKNTSIPLRLMDTRTSSVTPFAIGSTHLMFLTKKRSEDEPTEYRTIGFEGDNIQLSPFGHEKIPEGKTLEEKIKSLIKQTIEYRDTENKKEKEFLESIIK